MKKPNCIVVQQSPAKVAVGLPMHALVVLDSLGRFNPGDPIRTSPVAAMERDADGALLVVTRSGTVYKVLKTSREKQETPLKNYCVVALEDSPENFLKKGHFYQVLTPGRDRVTVKCLLTNMTTVVNCNRLETF